MNKDLKYYLNLPYKTVIEYEPDGGIWVAYCPELGRGTCYASSNTQQEALNLLEETKKEILQYALDENKKIPEPKFEAEELPSGHFVVRCSRTLHKKLKEESEKEGISLNQFVTSILAEYTGEKKIYALYKPIIASFTKLLFERVNLWQSSHFQIYSPILKVHNKENFNQWIIEGFNVEKEREETEIDWRYFSSPIPRVSEQSSSR
jgi:antitoxin HicB